MFTKEEIDFIKEESMQVDRSKIIPEKLVSFMYDKQLFKLFVPNKLGGKMLDLPEAARIFYEASRIDSNFGWLVTIGSGGGMFVANMTKKKAEEVYSAKDAVIAGSGYPAGTATKVNDGYVINGKWFYCSGSQYASTFTVTCKLAGSDDILAFALEAQDVHVCNDWDAFGLRGTSSHSIEVKDLLVSEDAAFSVFKLQNDYKYAIHTFPFLTFSETSFAAMSLGISDHFLNELDRFAKEHKSSWHEDRYNFLVDSLIEEKARHKKASDTFFKMLDLAWEKHEEKGSLEEDFQRGFTVMAKRVAATTVHCSEQLYRLIGMDIVKESTKLNQLWRDLHTATQHMFLMPTNKEEATAY